MKKTIRDELKTKTIDELTRKLADLSSEIDKLSTEEFQTAQKNVNLIRNKRKEIARVLTFLHIKEAMEVKSNG